MASMTEAQLLEELQQALVLTDAEEASTVREIADRLGVSPKTVRERLRALKRAGRLECVTVYRESIDGRMTPVPGFRLREGRE